MVLTQEKSQLHLSAKVYSMQKCKHIYDVINCITLYQMCRSWRQQTSVW